MQAHADAATPAFVVRPAARASDAGRCCAIAVMAKASHPGRTKTRLSPPLSPTQAAELNTVFLLDIADNVTLAAGRADIDCYMAYGPPDAVKFFEQHMQPVVGLLEAWLPNFGDCLWHAMRCLFDLGYGSACVLNSDSPTLPTSVLVDAAHALQRPGDRIVLGPSTDGGYYLLGMKLRHRRLFDDIAWSTGEVLEQTRTRAAELKLETVLLPTWYDIDDAATLRLLTGETLGNARFCAEHQSYEARHTTEFLRRSRDAGTLPVPAAPA